MRVESLTTVDEVFTRLDPNSDRWGPSMTTPWVFRGMGHELFDLLPSAWRTTLSGKETILQAYQRRDAHIIAELAQQAIGGADGQWQRRIELFGKLYAEFLVQSEFVQLADSLGLQVSVTEQMGYDGEAARLAQSIAFTGMYTGVSSTLALAQHAGLPTRLLDWTANPYIALFFAAFDEGAHALPDSDYMTVWALDRSALSPPGYSGEPNLEMYTPPMAGNDYMRAQQGCFTHCFRAELFYLEEGRWPRVDEYAERYASAESLIMIRFPKALAQDVLRRLWRLGLTPAHMRPTLEHAARALALRIKLEAR